MAKKHQLLKKISSENLEQPFLSLRDSINDLFDHWFEGWFNEEKPLRNLRLIEGNQLYAPKIDVVDQKDKVLVTAELPGMQEKDIEVIVTNDLLTIKGEKQEETKEEKKEYYHHERYYGEFERSIALPSNIDESKVTASFKNGILKIQLPKVAEQQTRGRKIEIK